MEIHQNYSLLGLNTFGLEAEARYFARAGSVEDVREAIQSGVGPILVLGGGSNLLFTRNFPGMALQNQISGIRVVEEAQGASLVEVGGGVVWHDFVLWAIENGLGGVENLSLIPGTVGAAPVQNIGAYGVELQDVFVSLQAVDLGTGELHKFSRKDCRFGYRDSIFKQEAKGKYCITSVLFALSKENHRLHITYGDISKTLEANGVHSPGIADISNAVVQIRSAKLPDPAKIGNCGSFFKNPETERAVLDRIQREYPQAPHYDLPDGRVKIPAGWLIEQCGFKGKRIGNTGCYEKQALVLVNYGGATGEEVRNLAYDIIDTVDKRFGILLEPEVNMV